MSSVATTDAYKYCQDTARRHYENFPVASWLLPTRLRKPISAIYAFARTADDFADEGDKPAAERLALLDSYTQKLRTMGTQADSDDPVFIALSDSCVQFNLDTGLLNDLLTAFKQDVSKKRYTSYPEVLEYCRYSANPVGRLLLQLVNKDSEQNRIYSDAICTALQLINFHQDIRQDFIENDRVYLALDEMQQSGIHEQDIFTDTPTDRVATFMHEQVTRADQMLLSGFPLCGIIGGRLGLELRFTVLGAHRVAEKMLKTNNVFARPRLSLYDWLITGLRVLSGKRYTGTPSGK